MCTPVIYIREDGKGFVVRAGGTDWEMREMRGSWFALNDGDGLRKLVRGEGDTIMEAVDAALAKLRAEKKPVNKD